MNILKIETKKIKETKMNLEKWVEKLNKEGNGGRYLTRKDFEAILSSSNWEIIELPNTRTCKMKLFYRLECGTEFYVNAVTINAKSGDLVKRGVSNRWNVIRFGPTVRDSSTMIGRYKQEAWDQAHSAISCFGNIRAK